MHAGAYIYILTDKPCGTLYVGVTSDLIRRAYQHREKQVDGFSKRYGLVRLVYYEVFEDIREAIEREKRLKKWNRNWKLRLVLEKNPEWRDLYEEICR